MTEVFGKGYASCYDRLYQEKDYDAEVALIGDLFRRFAAQPVRSVLDLGCGTGNHALRMAAEGFTVTGIERSPQMLAIAQAKATRLALDLELHAGDIRNVELQRQFDAALMMFAVLSYQTTNADVSSALQRARQHLRTGGLLVFDFWYAPAVLALGPEPKIRTMRHGDCSWTRTATGRLEAERNLCHVIFDLKHFRGKKLVDQSTETHTVRYFFSDEIDQFLERSRFTRVHASAFPEADRGLGPETWNALIVATAS